MNVRNVLDLFVHIPWILRIPNRSCCFSAGADALEASVAAVSKYGGASAGYRTMLDALIPASTVLKQVASWFYFSFFNCPWFSEKLTVLSRDLRLGRILWLPSSHLLKQHQLVLNPLNRCKQRYVIALHILYRNTPISFYNLDCSCRLDGHHTSLQTSWRQSLIQEQWLQLPGTELLLLQWRTSCTVQRASSVWSASIPYWQEEWPGHFLTPTLRFGFRLCFAWAEKETSILFHPSHIVQRDGQWVCRRYKLSETMLLHCPWYLRLLLVVVMIVVHLDRAVVCNS